jgi:4,5-DOPA dioxygenase extradiol
MHTEMQPVIFLSHGAPTLILEDVPAREFIRGLGSHITEPRGILCVSAHWETPRPSVNATKRHETIHDFYGFPQELYDIQYPAPGSEEIAEQVSSAIIGSGLACDIDRSRGLDHGAWVPISLMYPKADIPVVQLSIQHHLDPKRHYELGRALAPIRKKGVLIIGSGGAVHPLGFFTPRFDGSPPEPWAVEFEEWLTDKVEKGDHQSMIDYRAKAPYPERAHPRPDHYMPLIVAAGAAGANAPGKKMHGSWTWGDLGMGAYLFE